MEQSIAQQKNSASEWDRIWTTEGDNTWRAKALDQVYKRIIQLSGGLGGEDQTQVKFTDVGGGVGILAKQIQDAHAHLLGVVRDISPVAVAACQASGVDAATINLEAVNTGVEDITPADLYVSVECLEHLTEGARIRAMQRMSLASAALLSIPNNCMGPDVEPQHTIQYTAMDFKRLCLEYWDDVRIEVYGRYQLAVCGELARKPFKLSMTLPVRDEAHDLAQTLASFRGIADEMVVGIDPRTKDNTWEIAEQYADVVFHLENPMGPPPGHTKDHCHECTKIHVDIPEGEAIENIPCKEYMGEDGIHFAYARNQCIDRCTHDWIFMSEGHERLGTGQDVLLNLHATVPENARVGFVMRQTTGQQWGFPWLFRKAPDIRFTRPVHNVLDFPQSTYVILLPTVTTVHERHQEQTVARADQRHGQNRRQLMDDWKTQKNIDSLFYLGQEWRQIDPKRTMQRLDEFLVVANNGTQRYQARLILAKESLIAKDMPRAREYLMGCTADDWNRTEHWVWLGDIAMMEGAPEKAYRFYMYAASAIGNVPFSLWWIELSYYSYLPAQRLAQACAELGRVEESLVWAKQSKELLPEDSAQEFFDEATANITLLEDALGGT